MELNAIRDAKQPVLARLEALKALLYSYTETPEQEHRLGCYLHKLACEVWDKRSKSQRDQVKQLACALVDGLQYGNWPWNK